MSEGRYPDVWVIFTDGAHVPTDVISDREDGDTLPNETAVEYVPLAEVDRLRALNPGAEWLEPWCDEHHEDSPARGCVACIGASHDAWMHRAKWAEAENERLTEALREITAWAEAARGHYGIEECAGPGQPATEWDDTQDGLRNAALFAREVLDASSEPSSADDALKGTEEEPSP